VTAWAASGLLTASIVGRGASGSTRVVLATLAWGAALASGVARVIMGAHWPSDVVAGLALGSAWVGVVTVLGESRWGTRRPPAPHGEAARPPSG
jgi:undecaprenyl-diphosphatase